MNNFPRKMMIQYAQDDAEAVRAMFEDESIFNTQSWEVLYRFHDYGGMATCKQLSVKYGETPNFYNTGATTLAKRIAEKTGCDISVKEKDGNKRYWTILFVGRNANFDEEGVFVWKLRDELKKTLEDVDFSDIELYAEQSENGVNYWWLNANPKIWSFSDIEVGEEQNYTMYNDNGNKRRIFQNFLDAREGDINHLVRALNFRMVSFTNSVRKHQTIRNSHIFS